MQRLAPNTLLNNRFLLKEELSFDNQLGQQVWAVRDRQTNQALVARFHATGQVEWFSDNRPLVVAPPTSIINQQEQIPAVQSVAAQSPAMSVSKRAIAFLATMLLVGGLLAGYFYRNSLLHIIQSINSKTTTSADSIMLANRAATVTISPSYMDDQPLDENTVIKDGTETNEAAIESMPMRSRISDRQALRLLTQLKEIPSEKHAAIFFDARRAFAQLRQTSGQQPYLDSLYTLCMGYGAQSVLAYQQNGDAISRQYAVNWYTLAYAIKPNAPLQERVARLKGKVPGHPKKNPQSTKTSGSSLFMADPEVNH